jgi:hypothetical protein
MKDLKKQLIEQAEKLINACIDADLQEDYDEVREFKLTLEKFKEQRKQ